MEEEGLWRGEVRINRRRKFYCFHFYWFLEADSVSSLESTQAETKSFLTHPSDFSTTLVFPSINLDVWNEFMLINERHSIVSFCVGSNNVVLVLRLMRKGDDCLCFTAHRGEGDDCLCFTALRGEGGDCLCFTALRGEGDDCLCFTALRGEGGDCLCFTALRGEGDDCLCFTALRGEGDGRRRKTIPPRSNCICVGLGQRVGGENTPWDSEGPGGVMSLCSNGLSPGAVILINDCLHSCVGWCNPRLTFPCRIPPLKRMQSYVLPNLFSLIIRLFFSLHHKLEKKVLHLWRFSWWKITWKWKSPSERRKRSHRYSFPRFYPHFHCSNDS